MPASEVSIVNRKAFACGVIIWFWLILSVNAQEIDLEKVLDRAYLATVDYRETFKNLAAEELKTYDLFRKDGSLDDSRQIRSIFVVYQSEYTVEGSNATMEFRNVIEFNGKAVARDDDDIVKFFEKLSKSSSRAEEYRRLKSDGNRFDGKTHVNGFTLGQGIPLQPSVRSFFEFQIIGNDKIDGHDVVIIEYRQTKPTLRIKANATDAERKQQPNGYSFITFLPDSFRPTNPRIVGKLWIDAKTGRIWRDEYDVTIQPAALSNPIAAFHFLSQYQSSDFGILVPQRLEVMRYRISGKTEKDLRITKAARNLFEYTKFTRPKTDVKESSINGLL